MREEEAAAVFQALSNADRLRVIRILVAAGPEGLGATEIAEKMGASPSRASFHLAGLTEAGLIQRQRQSRSLIYTVDFVRLGGLVRFLLEDCCNNSLELRACCS
ncbi:ArsR/SmtB family transcription factor [uncultured Roseobacter sp.]|uniref:ArsR/SmtB family transcription factor n=1 Tax=uncultured Roseobacter sp. TaxID=114847 RepID=UPI00345CA5A2